MLTRVPLRIARKAFAQTVLPLAVAITLIGTASGLRAAQGGHEQHHATPAPAATKPQAPAKADDYLVQVGKHVMWKSQVLIMHPELAKKVQPLSRKAGTDYVVHVGKTAVPASSLRRVEGPHATRPAPHDAACKDYLVQAGKTTVWASEIGAPCPAGPHKGENRPLCCVASLETGKNMPACCKEAQGQ